MASALHAALAGHWTMDSCWPQIVRWKLCLMKNSLKIQRKFYDFSIVI